MPATTGPVTYAAPAPVTADPYGAPVSYGAPAPVTYAAPAQSSDPYGNRVMGERKKERERERERDRERERERVSVETLRSGSL